MARREAWGRTKRAFMDRLQSARARLRRQLDAQGDLAPPWEKYPAESRSHIFWRMHPGEEWLQLWRAFLEQLPNDRQPRVDFLRRHPPAPVNWSDFVVAVLNPIVRGGDWDSLKPAEKARRRAALLEQGFVASDAAYTTWLRQQRDVALPWQDYATPAEAIMDIRRFWFVCRRLAESSVAGIRVPRAIPRAWEACAGALQTGETGPIDPRQAALALALGICAGRVKAPWELDLTVREFTGDFSVESDYATHFWGWVLFCLDDDKQVRNYLEVSPPPRGWKRWTAQYVTTF